MQPIQLDLPRLLSDGESLSSFDRDPERRPIYWDAPAKRCLHAVYQPHPSAGWAFVPRMFQGNSGAEGELSVGIGPLYRTQSGTGRNGGRTRQLALEQLPADSGNCGEATVADDRLAAVGV